MEPLPARTPLYDWHARLGARFVPFAGWEMPVQYTGIIEEHLAARRTAGLFDVSHMGEARVSGRDAAASLERIMTNAMSSIPVGRARYSFMCREDGGVVDDVIVYRFGPEEFFICLNAGNAPGDVAHLRAHVFGDCTVADETLSWAQLAIQGPRAVEIVQALADRAVASLPRFAFVSGQCAGADVIFSRTGYTGEDGFELYVPPAQAEALADALMTQGRPLGLLPVGLGARDSLRLEAGYPLYGHEISETITPLQAGLGWAVKLNKGAFLGQQALAAEAAQGPAHRVVFFTLDDRRIARQGMPVFQGDTPVGEIRSGTLSPVKGKPIGSARVRTEALAGPLAVEVRGQKIPLTLATPPLYP